eukprot:6177409-Pleurochrysis_carterae.AAC.2
MGKELGRHVICCVLVTHAAVLHGSAVVSPAVPASGVVWLAAAMHCRAALSPARSRGEQCPSLSLRTRRLATSRITCQRTVCTPDCLQLAH